MSEGNKRVLGGVPVSLPAMIKAHRIQDKVRAVGFDWENRDDIWFKVQEEIGEVKEEIQNGANDRIEEEFGDLFFSIINAARLNNIEPESALEKTNKKFIRRFNYIEEKVKASGGNLKEMNIEEMEAIWNEAKLAGK